MAIGGPTNTGRGGGAAPKPEKRAARNTATTTPHSSTITFTQSDFEALQKNIQDAIDAANVATTAVDNISSANEIDAYRAAAQAYKATYSLYLKFTYITGEKGEIYDRFLNTLQKQTAINHAITMMRYDGTINDVRQAVNPTTFKTDTINTDGIRIAAVEAKHAATFVK